MDYKTYNHITNDPSLKRRQYIYHFFKSINNRAMLSIDVQCSNYNAYCFLALHNW